MRRNKIAIIGAGIAGPCLAIELASQGHEVQIFESRNQKSMKDGAFLSISPNGLNILQKYISIENLKQDYSPGSISFLNKKGKPIGELPNDYQEKEYGQSSFQVRRSHLVSMLIEKANEKRINIQYNEKCIRIDQDENLVTLFFEGDKTASFDYVFGCDGTFSVTRKFLFPEVKLNYTKNLSTAGFTNNTSQLHLDTKSINMIFGTIGFFAYAVSNNGEIWWFNNIHHHEEPSKQELREVLPAQIRNKLLKIHKNDTSLINTIVSSTENIIVYPIYDLPRLNQWHKGRVCLIGDAAHAISPHIGQGASLALEDVVILSEILKHSEDFIEGFEQYYDERHERVEKIVAQARGVGNNKTKPSPIAVWFRDRLMKYFLKSEIKKMDWIYSFNPQKITLGMQNQKYNLNTKNRNRDQ